MKLSDALRLADEMGLPNDRRNWVANNTRAWKGERPPACAVAGANIAARISALVPDANGFVPKEQVLQTSSPALFGDAIWRKERCPLCPLWVNLYDTVVHLYCTHKWSRTQIAGWVDSLEAVTSGRG